MVLLTACDLRPMKLWGSLAFGRRYHSVSRMARSPRKSPVTGRPCLQNPRATFGRVVSLAQRVLSTPHVCGFGLGLGTRQLQIPHKSSSLRYLNPGRGATNMDFGCLCVCVRVLLGEPPTWISGFPLCPWTLQARVYPSKKQTHVFDQGVNFKVFF